MDVGLLASLCLFAHNNTRPLDGEGAGGATTGWGGRGGGAHFPGPSPLCASGGKGGRGLPLTPQECKQQQMNKNKNTKGRRKVLGVPPPWGLPCHQWRSPHCPIHQSCLSPGAAQCRPHPQGQSPGLRTAGPAAHTGDGRRAPCWCAGSAGTSEPGRWAPAGADSPPAGL